MKKLLAILMLLFCVGCSNDVDQKSIKAGQFLCFDQDGLAAMEISSIGNDLYVCNDGAQFVVEYVSVSNGDGTSRAVYKIAYNKDEAVNAMLDGILQGK